MAGNGFVRVPGGIADTASEVVRQEYVDGAALVSNVQAAFTPGDLTDNLTMDGSAQIVALATGTTKLEIFNPGATTQAIRVGFGASEAAAIAALSISGGLATTGYFIPAVADAGAAALREPGVPQGSTHAAICNAVAAGTQVVPVVQGA